MIWIDKNNPKKIQEYSLEEQNQIETYPNRK